MKTVKISIILDVLFAVHKDKAQEIVLESMSCKIPLSTLINVNLRLVR